MSKILIIDDDQEMCVELKDVLEDEGNFVQVVNDGEEGLRFANSYVFDGVILDLKMPGMDGYEVLRSIKKERVAIKVIILTGTPIDKDILLIKGAAQDNYKDIDNLTKNDLLKLADVVLSKPFDVEVLLKEIKELLS